jgi:hypothetical protein
VQRKKACPLYTNSDRESEIPQEAMSALPPKATEKATSIDVGFVPISYPIALQTTLFEHLVGELRKFVFSALCASRLLAR